MIRQISAFTLAFLFICAGVYANDTNDTESFTTITSEELAIALAELRLETQTARNEIVTVRMDSETQQLFARLEDKMVLFEQKLIIIEDRFMILKNDLADKIDTSAAKTTSDISIANNKQIADLTTAFKQFVRDMTNPIRINLPNFGLWLMVTSAFMLIAGLRRQKAVKDVKRETKKIEIEGEKDGRQ